MASRKKGHGVAITATMALTALTAQGSAIQPPSPVEGERLTYSLQKGEVSFEFDTATLEALNWTVAATGEPGKKALAPRAKFTIIGPSTLEIEAINGVFQRVRAAVVRTRGGMLVGCPGGRSPIGNVVLEVNDEGTWTVRNPLGKPDNPEVIFEISSVFTELPSGGAEFRLIGELSIAESWAGSDQDDPCRTGIPETAGIVIGRAVIAALLSSPQADEGQDGAGMISASPAADPFPPGRNRGESGAIGPDIIVGDLQGTALYGRVGELHAYAVGTHSCNIGDERAAWHANTNEHPVIAQNMYRLKDGRFEQIGMSWVKHGFYVLSEHICSDSCDDETGGTELGVGCSDAYSAGLNGQQNNLSLRSEVNAHTGHFDYPWTAPDPEPVIGRRLQVHEADLDPDQNPEAVYFVQGHYVAADDAAAGNNNNNASYRSVMVTPLEDTYNIVVTGETQREQPALRGWQDSDPEVLEVDIQVPGEGLFIHAAKATHLGTGVWRYEYAVQNLNSDRSAGSFSVPINPEAVIQNIGFEDVDYHSGEIYDLTDWDGVASDGPECADPPCIFWSTQSYDENPSANALRWSTLYNFRFDANVEPDTTTVTLGLFKPGYPLEMNATSIGPSMGLIDCNDNAIPDVCDIDCGPSGGPCDLPECGQSQDCNTNGVPDECEPDCNTNGVADECDIRDGTSPDCNENTWPDECEVPPIGPPENDCNGNGVPDECETLPDADGDDVADCYDLCPETTPQSGCACPGSGVCVINGIPVPGFPRHICCNMGGVPDCGTPDCLGDLCHDGCLIGDGDDDGDLDLRDFGILMPCYSGAFDDPDYVPPVQECTFAFDFDGDEDIDLVDFKRYRSMLTGPQ